jgi:hypothetical protein
MTLGREDSDCLETVTEKSEKTIGGACQNAVFHSENRLRKHFLKVQNRKKQKLRSLLEDKNKISLKKKILTPHLINVG